MSRFMPGIFAVVEIGGDPSTLLLIGGVFLATFIVVGVAAYWLIVRSRPGPQGTTTWQVDISRQLPVSKTAFDRIASTTAAALSRPEITPDARASLENLKRARSALAGFYRIAMIAIGLAGIALSVLLFRQADSANMIGLPAGIILLFSLGALGNGLIPSRTVAPVEPIDPALLDKIKVQVSRQPLTVSLGTFEMMKAAEMLRRGSSPEAAARAVYPAYDGLGEFEKEALRNALRQALAEERP